MSINYSMTKESEKELRDYFFKYYHHVYDSWNDLIKVYKEKKQISKEDLNHFFDLENKSNTYEVMMLDDCIWDISKNQPLASHLRFVVSIIYSISDLERMADYVISIARYMHDHPITEEALYEIILASMQDSVFYMDKIVSLLKDPINTKTNWKKTYNKTIKYSQEYHEKLEKNVSKLTNVMYDQSNAKNVYKIYTLVAKIIKNVERNVDHSTNLIENFIYIRNNDFFHSKKSKQLPKIEMRMTTRVLKSKKSHKSKSKKVNYTKNK